jgi:hypothetical protein
MEQVNVFATFIRETRPETLNRSFVDLIVSVPLCILLIMKVMEDRTDRHVARKAEERNTCRALGRRSCDRPPRHRFFLVCLYLKANAEMVPKIPSCHYMLLM